MIQPQGDGNTGFVVHGAGWPPLTPVTVALADRGNASVRVMVDGAGIFNCTIDQGHAFYPGPIPPGHHEVVVTGGGRRLTTAFDVRPPGAIPSPAP